MDIILLTITHFRKRYKLHVTWLFCRFLSGIFIYINMESISNEILVKIVISKKLIKVIYFPSAIDVILILFKIKSLRLKCVLRVITTGGLIVVR